MVDAFDAFKQNADQCNQRIRNINRNTFQTEMARVLGAPKGNGNKYWKDWMIIESYDDDDNDEDSESDTE